MSLRWMDGFDHYGGSLLETGQGGYPENITANVARSYDTVGGAGFLADSGRFNGSALYAVGSKNNTYIFKNIGSSAATKYFIGFNLKFNTNNASFQFICGSVVSNAMATTRGFFISNTTVYLNNTAITTLSQNIWHHIEMEIPVTPSGGDPCRLYINGTQVGTTTTTFNWTNVVGLLAQNYTNGTYQAWVDDFYIFDNLGTTNNTKAATELYIPRIESIQPTSDVSNNFTGGGLTVVNQGFESTDATNTSIGQWFSITNDLLACGFTNISFLNYAAIVGIPYYYNYINSTTTFKRTGTYAKELRYTYSSGAAFFQFDTIASSITFYVVPKPGTGACECNVTLNGTLTTYNLADNSTWTQITVTPVDGIVNTVKIAVGAAYGRYLLIDDMQVTYTSKAAAQVLFKTKFSSSNYLSSTANGDKVLCNMENLTNINNIKAVSMVAMASEAVTAVTSSFKFIANNGGSDIETGSTKSVVGSLISTTAYQQEFFDTNPLTSLPWTSSDINNIKIGVINKT